MRDMKARIAMGAALAVAFGLALLLAFLLFLLADLFCSLVRDKQRRDREAGVVPPEYTSSWPLSFPFYGHGVLNAPTKYLLSAPVLEAAAMKQASPPPCQSRHCDSAGRFVCISNPIYDRAANGNGKDDVEVVERSPSLKVMEKLPAAVLVDGRRSLPASTEGTNKASPSSSSNSMCSSPSW